MLKFAVTLCILVGILLISNTNGFFLSAKEKCEVSIFKGGKDFGGEKIMAHKLFVPSLKSIGSVAKACKVQVHVTDSFKRLKTPNDFTLTSEMPLIVGHGIRFDLKDQKGGTLCNPLCMKSRSWRTLNDANCFINGVQKKGIKFTEPNLLDDGQVAKLSSVDAEKLKVQVQKVCAPKTKAPKG
ncbi:unnamed protein product [Rotaria sordida]|uniref:Uncharacterized protein n=1 Tax=Rotaria sordida TaxID=392033 RepID=A0A819GCR7_9BILA|nr:unnamed protein product [Rotaria sordida]CAF1171665.1 unnamed protein product [Rotaria sordida]CAF1239959.1 unnamed protein product [Rotaria sordida]CAF1425666.1 unnamed protein product [Rotaria sordida]CAF3866144.1 unnamed protein product [Rotaria sordida]